MECVFDAQKNVLTGKLTSLKLCRHTTTNASTKMHARLAHLFIVTMAVLMLTRSVHQLILPDPLRALGGNFRLDEVAQPQRRPAGCRDCPVNQPPALLDNGAPGGENSDKTIQKQQKKANAMPMLETCQKKLRLTEAFI